LVGFTFFEKYQYPSYCGISKDSSVTFGAIKLLSLGLTLVVTHDIKATLRPKMRTIVNASFFFIVDLPCLDLGFRIWDFGKGSAILLSGFPALRKAE
jgi:hypothetical protein